MIREQRSSPLYYKTLASSPLRITSNPRPKEKPQDPNPLSTRTSSKESMRPSILHLSRTSISHMDSERIIDVGLSQMLSLLVNHEADVHLIGGCDEALYQNTIGSSGSARLKKPNGFSLPLCSKIIEALQNRKESFHLQTLCVLGHNTKKGSRGHPLPIISGFLVDTLSGSVVPASFDRTSRSPDEIVRRVRLSVAFEDPSWKGKLLESYDTRNDRFRIAPCSWMPGWGDYCSSMLQLPDSEILLQCSTSPAAESPDFVENERRIWKYLIKHP